MIISLDELIERCGYFRDGVEVNNGYGCSHPEQREAEDGQGKCYGFSCPLGSELNPESEPLDRPAFGAGDEWKSMSDGYWMDVGEGEGDEPAAIDIGSPQDIPTIEVTVRGHRCKPHGWRP